MSERLWILTVIALFLPTIVLLRGGHFETRAAEPLKVDTDFSGGSAKVEGIDQDGRTLRILPGGPPERGWVCWWYFKVEGIQKGETLTLDVGGGVWATPDRAFYSLDNKEWKPLEAGERTKDRITYKQKIDVTTAWFAWGPPFVLADARELSNRRPRLPPRPGVRAVQEQGRPGRARPACGPAGSKGRGATWASGCRPASTPGSRAPAGSAGLRGVACLR